MKKNILIMAMAGLLIGFASCSKDETEPVASALDASKTTKIKKGEPISFKFTKAPEGSIVQWSVTPDKDVKINTTGNIASILFATAGSYKVNATYGSLKGTSEVSVQDSLFNPGNGGPATILPLTGDQIAIAVTKMPDSMGLVGLNLSFLTKNKYKCLNNRLLFNGSNVLTNNMTTYKIDFTGVEIPSDEFCVAGNDYSKGVTSFYPIADGESKLVIVLNGITYSGSIQKSGSAIAITWTYTSGVTISPLNLK